ncbi:ABC transporter permease [Opitutus sp. ER46]|uniref:ABC transporter permease n=1 Tax=Opitutus sp. ER46 TaxID=2161864 RepID=UPI000D30B3A9|nr:ABC transporter permease [Opitutus sp. ER46]PTX98455.1 multidrug ABC transporter substrate-binding protein [Opitutus sp. ER46]
MKRLLAILRVALRALRRNVLRTFLTMLGIIIGVAAVIGMVSIGTGARVQVEQQIAALGQNVIMVMAGNMSRGGMFSGMGGAPTLTLEDAFALRNEVDGVATMSPEVRGNVQVVAGNLNWNVQVMGVSHEYLDLRAWPLSEGDFFTEQDIRASTRTCVLGQTTAKKLFEDASPIGAAVRVKGIPFTVVAVLAPKGSNMMGQDQDDVVFVPYSTAMRRLFGQNFLRAINLGAASPDRIKDVTTQVAELLRQRHRIQPGRDDDFMVRTQQEITEFATSTAKTMTGLLGAIAGVSLLVGGIGIMNIMLVSVTERTREIGIRLAVGARRRDILRQFLTEAVVLSIAGGLVGIATGVGVSMALAAQFNWPTLTPTYAVAGAFLFSAMVGVFFGYYPARKAAQLDPIEALRYE